MHNLRTPVAAALVAICLGLAGCGVGDTEQSRGQPNISLEGTPNDALIGPVDPHLEAIEIPLHGRGIVAAFRAHECGHPAPDFERTMQRLTRDGLRVPNGITLYDAGIGYYTSSRCKAQAEARAIGVYGYQHGTYQLEFFGGKVKRSVQVN